MKKVQVEGKEILGFCKKSKTYLQKQLKNTAGYDFSIVFFLHFFPIWSAEIYYFSWLLLGTWLTAPTQSAVFSMASTTDDSNGIRGIA